jgi:hypothetical protein
LHVVLPDQDPDQADQLVDTARAAEARPLFRQLRETREKPFQGEYFNAGHFERMAALAPARLLNRAAA